MGEIPQFGERIEGVRYFERPGAYVILVNPWGQVAIIDVDGHFHLPGGGIEPGESAVEAARREALEEVGIAVSFGAPIGRANQYVYSTLAKRHFNKLCTYFLGKAVGQCRSDPAAQHEAVWVQPEDARKRLDHASHAWAIAKAASLIATPYT